MDGYSSWEVEHKCLLSFEIFVLLRSHDPYSIVTGALSAGVFAVAFLVALALYIYKRGFLPADVTNEAEGIAPPVAPRPAEEPAAEVPSYRPIARRTIAIGIVVAVVLAVLRFVPVASFGDWVEFRTTPAKARSIASDFLRNQGYDVSSLP